MYGEKGWISYSQKELKICEQVCSSMRLTMWLKQ